MRKSLLRELINECFKGGKLDKRKVFQISEDLDRAQLREFIKALRLTIKQRTVFIQVPITQSQSMTDELSNLFPGKEIIIEKNPSLMVGARIIYNDDVFELNLKNNLDRVVDYIQEEYD